MIKLFMAEKKKEEIMKEMTNPIEILWDLLCMPEEERIHTSHLYDYCEEECIEGDPLNSYVEKYYDKD